MMVSVSISGSKSTGNFDQEKRPKITTATKQSAVIIGFFTAPSYILILFYNVNNVAFAKYIYVPTIP